MSQIIGGLCVFVSPVSLELIHNRRKRLSKMQVAFSTNFKSWTTATATLESLFLLTLMLLCVGFSVCCVTVLEMVSRETEQHQNGLLNVSVTKTVGEALSNESQNSLVSQIRNKFNKLLV